MSDYIACASSAIGYSSTCRVYHLTIKIVCMKDVYLPRNLWDQYYYYFTDHTGTLIVICGFIGDSNLTYITNITLVSYCNRHA